MTCATLPDLPAVTERSFENENYKLTGTPAMYMHVVVRPCLIAVSSFQNLVHVHGLLISRRYLVHQ